MPIYCSLNIERLSTEQFRSLDYAVMGQVFASQNNIGRLADEQVYRSDVAQQLNSLGVQSDEEVQIELSEPFYYYNCENLQAVRAGDWKLHLPRNKEQLPFWDKNKAFANLEQPVLYNLRIDRAETTDVAADNPEVVRQMQSVAESARKELGEFMHRGEAQRPTGSIFPDGPVISHEKDWGTVATDTAEAITREQKKRHPNLKQPKSRRKKQD